MATTSRPLKEDAFSLVSSTAATPEPAVDGGWEWIRDRDSDDYCLGEDEKLSMPATAAPLSEVQPMERIASVISKKKVRFADEIEKNHKSVHFSDWDELIVYTFIPPLPRWTFSAFDVELVFEPEVLCSEEQVPHCEPDDLDLKEFESPTVIDKDVKAPIAKGRRINDPVLRMCLE
ncbi:hypothetical protein DFP72DRAFT_839596 [Ephemerocybe angulata]|uniref:Uncharacterized protein n=1 Tax=Ephemerocybe angulata TaxID=980116 RepID=A0A8H6IHS8_9AGAR|nr:hypothetical protein DFP72DRAFT_839596 [Tulosesus angulatus]